jgi:Holliday junction resolvase RusA-like endonuclease
MKPIEVVIAGLPPTDNNAYRTGDGGRRYLTTAAENWKAWVGIAVNQALRHRKLRVDPDALYEIHLRFYFKELVENGEIRQWDVSSHQKLTIDAIAEALGSDDKHCMRLVAEKLPAKGGKQTQIDIVLY